MKYLLIAVLALPVAAAGPPTAAQLLALTTELRDGIDASDKSNPSVGSLMVRLRLAQAELEDAAPGTLDRPRLATELAALCRDAAEVSAGKSLLQPGRDIVLGYWSELDDSWQPYRLWLPGNYRADTPWPLLVLLHGQNGFAPMQCEIQHLWSTIVVGPQGRGGIDFMGIGELDVLRVIDDVQRHLNVDRARLSISGSSMGATGAWHLATRYPDRFCGVAAMYGNTDVGVWESRWLRRTPGNSPQRAVRDFLRHDTSAVTYAANLLNVDVIAMHGSRDFINHVSHLESMQRALAELGRPYHRFHVLPLVSHGFGIDYEHAIKDFTYRSQPLQVRYRGAWLRYPGAYWLRVTAMHRRLQFHEVEGTAAADRLSVQTANVAELAVLTERLPFAAPAATLRLDGRDWPAAAWARGEFAGQPAAFFHRPSPQGDWAAGRLPAAGTYPPRKSASVEGPVEHAFRSRFLLVTGSGATGEPLWARQAAADFAKIWQERFATPCLQRRDDDVTEADLATSNLILFGGPQANALTAKVAAQLPLTFRPDGIGLGPATYSGAGVGVEFCYPNPLSPQRYVVVIAGLDERAYRQVNLRFGNWFDWIVYDYRRHFDFAVFDERTIGRHPETFVVWGIFDESWRLDPTLVFPGVPAWRTQIRPRVLASLARGTGRSQFLDELQPLSATFPKEYLERQRDFDGGVLQLNGRAYARGLCARTPCRIRFDCAGYDRLQTTAGIEWDGKSPIAWERTIFEFVDVVIRADDDRELYRANGQGAKSPPLQIDIPLHGTKWVGLEVDGGMSWLNGSFVWADARLTRE